MGDLPTAKRKESCNSKKLASIDRKLLKNNKLNVKLILNQAISTYGVEGVLFPSAALDGRHRFTQEVMLLADEHGIKQQEIADLCGVSQPTVSGWENGEGRALCADLERLTRKIAALAPGNEFYTFDIATFSECELKEDWEVEMLALHLNVEPNELKQELWDNIKQDVRAEFEATEQNMNIEIQQVEQFISELSSLVPLAEKEKTQNQIEDKRYKSDIEHLLASKPEYAALDDDSKQILFDRQVQPPQHQDHHERQIKKLNERVLSTYTEFQIEHLFESLEQKRDELREELKLFRQEAEEKELAALEQKSPLNKHQAVEETICISKEVVDKEVSSAVIKELSARLFEHEKYYKFSVRIQSPRDWYDRTTKNVDAEFTELFSQYANNLKFTYTQERVQLCGQFLFNHQHELSSEYYHEIPPGKNTPICTSERHQDYGRTFDLFRLYSNKLALVEGIFDELNDECYYELKQFVQLDELLDYLESKIDSSIITEWKETLMKLGYISESVRLIY